MFHSSKCVSFRSLLDGLHVVQSLNPILKNVEGSAQREYDEIRQIQKTPRHVVWYMFSL
jgi:hypothetical protein